MNKLKICFCISGQVRDIQDFIFYEKAATSISEFFNVDLVFSCWAYSDSKKTGAMGYEPIKRIVSKELFECIPLDKLNNEIHNFLPSIFQNESKLINEYIANYHRTIVDLEDEFGDLNFESRQSDPNSIKMLYKRWRCNEICKRQSKAFESEYDLIIVTRPDYRFNLKPEQIDLLINNSINISDVPGVPNDVLWAGKPRLINSFINQLYSKALSGDWNGIHAEVSSCLSNYSFNTLGGVNDSYLKSPKKCLKDIIGDNPFLDKLSPIINSGTVDEIIHELSISNSTSFSSVLQNILSRMYYDLKDYESSLYYFILSKFLTINSLELKLGRLFKKDTYTQLSKLLLCCNFIHLYEIDEIFSVKENSQLKSIIELIQNDWVFINIHYSDFLLKIKCNAFIDWQLYRSTKISKLLAKALIQNALDVMDTDRVRARLLLSKAIVISPDLPRAKRLLNRIKGN